MQNPVVRSGILCPANGSRHLTLFNSMFPKRRISYLLILHHCKCLFSVSHHHVSLQSVLVGLCGTFGLAPELLPLPHWINEFLCVSTLCPCSREGAVHIFVLRTYRKVNTCLCWNEVRCPGNTNMQELKGCSEGNMHGAADSAEPRLHYKHIHVFRHALIECLVCWPAC